MFGPYRGAVLHMQMVGRNAITYVAHGDPSRSGANFGFAIAHLENLRMTNDDEPDEPHVVFDMITHWEPSTFVNNNHEIDYDFIVTEMCGYINDFMPEEMTFDQGYSAMIIQQLRKYVATHPMPKRVNVWERTATAGRNWEVAETFKTALGMGLIHAPPTSSSPSVELLSNELKFLQLVTPNKVDHPTSGPVTTKDIADCVMILTHALVGGYIAAITGANLMALPLSGSQPGGMPTSPFLPSSPEQMAAAFSNFGRAATPTQGFDPARGRPLGGRGGGGGGRRY